jgi:hypothetical protein
MINSKGDYMGHSKSGGGAGGNIEAYSSSNNEFPDSRIEHIMPDQGRRRIQITLVRRGDADAARRLCDQCTHKLAARNGGGLKTRCEGIHGVVHKRAIIYETQIGAWDNQRTQQFIAPKAKCLLQHGHIIEATQIVWEEEL